MAKFAPKYQVGDIVHYRSSRGDELPGVVESLGSPKKYSQPIYYIRVKDWYGKGSQLVSAYEEHVRPAQRSLFAVKKKFEVGDQVLYDTWYNDNRNGLPARVIDVKWRPHHKRWIYTIDLGDGKKTSVWGEDIWPAQQTFPVMKAKRSMLSKKANQALSSAPWQQQEKIQNSQSWLKELPGISFRMFVNPSLTPDMTAVKGFETDLEVFAEDSLVPPDMKDTDGLVYHRERFFKDEPRAMQDAQKLMTDVDAMTLQQFLDMATPTRGTMAMVRVPLSKKANWIEKSRDMYHVEQKPVGKDYKKVKGPAPTHIPNTWTELPEDKQAAKVKPKFLKGDQIQYWSNGKMHPGIVYDASWNKKWQRIEYTLLIDNHFIHTFEGDFWAAQEEMLIPPRKYSMKITAGDVVPFDPNRRKPSAPMTQITELSPEMQEEREAVFYAFDNMVKDMEGLFNNFMALGEADLANNISAAYHALTGEILSQK